MPKAIGYFREEIPPREDESSLAEQNRAFLQFCKREGLEVGATFSDTNTSGGFRQMLDYLRRNGKGARVVVDTLNRLGLDLSGTARSYFQLGGLGVPVVTLDDPSNTTETLLASWRNRDPSDRPGERVKAAMRRKAIKGEVLGRPAYGYRVGSRKRLEPVAEEAAIVRRIFRLYNQEGLGIRLVARRLNEDGSKTRRGGNWSMVTIRDILRNRVYLGTYARFGVRVPGSHPAIVTSDEH
ncbi:MAG: recombinase family protein, partial [Dehalococcoidia bacterium]